MDISIIIPVYNGERYIEACVRSVLAADLPCEYEIILSDDGSNDDSPAIVDRLAQEYPQITAIHFENGGLSAARNRGVSCASGKYLFFIDCDDLILPEYLPRLLRKAEEERSDIVMAGFTAMSEGGEQSKLVFRPVLEPVGTMSGTAFLKRRMDGNDWNNEVWCALYRRSFWDEKGIHFRENIRLYEDIYFSTYVLFQAQRVTTVPEYGYIYRICRNSLVHDDAGKPMRKEIDACIQVLGELVRFSEGLNPQERRLLGRVMFQLVSMILYYVGEVEPDDRSAIFHTLRRKEVMSILRRSISSTKEAVKYLIFRFCMGAYYPLVRKENAGELL